MSKDNLFEQMLSRQNLIDEKTILKILYIAKHACEIIECKDWSMYHPLTREDVIIGKLGELKIWWHDVTRFAVKPNVLQFKNPPLDKLDLATPSELWGSEYCDDVIKAYVNLTLSIYFNFMQYALRPYPKIALGVS
jgi:hypothetical protein